MSTLKTNVQIGVGNLQLCGGHAGGCEVGVHAVVDPFNDDNAEGVVQVDMSNIFNSMKQKILLHKAKVICPEFSKCTHSS